MEYDDDIAAMQLTEVEKNGLQVFRNYQRKFEDFGEKQFAEHVDGKAFDLSDLKHVLHLITSEDIRFTPVIACAYADDLLKKMFNNEVPEDVPGGKSNLLGPFGPFSDLSKRLQLSFVFRILSTDLITDLNYLRTVRNKISHSWDISRFETFFENEPASKIFAIDALLEDDQKLSQNDIEKLTPIKRFRMRIVWMIARLSYEAPLFAQARRRTLDPRKALFGPNHPKRLAEISKAAKQACKKLVS